MSGGSEGVRVAGGALAAAGGAVVAVVAGAQVLRIGGALGLTDGPGLTAAGSAAALGGAAVASAVEGVVASGVLLVGVVLGCWFAATGLGVAACAVLRGSGRRWRRGEETLRAVGVPVLRRFAGTAAGAVVGTSLALSGASAAPADLPDDLGWAPTVTETAPDRAQDAEPLAGRTVAAAVTVTSSEVHVVAPGDSLWSIAAARVVARGVAATPAAVAAEWPRWYRANAAVIGDDPDLIHPGQVLTAPEEGTLP